MRPFIPAAVPARASPFRWRRRNPPNPPTLKATAKAAKAEAPRQRSPNYPSISLPDAVAKAVRLYEGVGTAGAPPDSAAKLIGYSRNHGTARMTASALKKFGLLDERNGRLVPGRYTVDLANFPPTHPRHAAALRGAALSPTIYREVFGRYRPHGVLPPDEVLSPELVADAGFLPDKVGRFLRDFRDSLAHAGLLRGNALVDVETGAERFAAENADDAPAGPAVGDTVTWTVPGDDEEEADEQEGLVQGLSDDGAFAFIAGLADGVPVADLSIVPPEDDADAGDGGDADHAAPPPPNPFAPAAAAPSSRTEAFALQEGDAVLRRPDALSAESLDELEEWFGLVMKKLRRLQAAESGD